MKICKFVEGSFIPSFDGASQRFAHIAKNLSNLGAEVTIIHCYRGWSDLNQIKSQKFCTYAISPKYYYHDHSVIEQIIERIRPDVIEMNDMELLMSVGLFLNKRYKIPLIFDAHFISSIIAKDITKDENAVQIERNHEKCISKIVSGTICYTNTDKRDLISSTKMTLDRIRVIPLGSDIDAINFRKVSNNDNAILFLGNMYFQPNQEAVEDIVNNIAPLVFKKNKNVIFKFVGDVPKNIKIKYQSERIKFLGRVADINQAFDGVRVCIVPIKIGSGMRVKVLTYMATGIPIISTKIAVDGIRTEKFINIANNDIDFANKIIEIINDVEKSSRQGELAYQEAKKNHSWEQISKKCLDFYKTTIKKPVFSSLDPVKVDAEPFWLTETLQKGRFEKKDINQEHIFIAKNGQLKTIKTSCFLNKDNC